MSAAAFIRTQDVPPAVLARRALRNAESGDVLIAFDGCPLVGIVHDEQLAGDYLKAESVEFPFPRDAQLRGCLVDWLLYHGISFTVVT